MEESILNFWGGGGGVMTSTPQMATLPKKPIPQAGKPTFVYSELKTFHLQTVASLKSVIQ